MRSGRVEMPEPAFVQSDITSSEKSGAVGLKRIEAAEGRGVRVWGCQERGMGMEWAEAPRETQHER